MPVIRTRTGRDVRSPAISTSIVSPSATKVTLPVQIVQVGWLFPAMHGRSLVACAVEATPTAAAAATAAAMYA